MYYDSYVTSERHDLPSDKDIKFILINLIKSGRLETKIVEGKILVNLLDFLNILEPTKNKDYQYVSNRIKE